jgi:hypothetical protein
MDGEPLPEGTVKAIFLSYILQRYAFSGRVKIRGHCDKMRLFFSDIIMHL